MYGHLLELINTKERIIIDIIKEGQSYLEDLGIPRKIAVYATSIVFRYLQFGKIPQNFMNYFVSALYIAQRHPLAFPLHQKKSKFCNLYPIQESSLEYCVTDIVRKLSFTKIYDDKNYPYFLDPLDIGYKLLKNLVERECQEALVNFFNYHQSINAQILSEKLTTISVLDMNIYPEELMRQIYEVIFKLVSNELKEYNNYVKLQQKYFI